jgi:cytoskeletal protein CcmA (bactofilin family)
MSQQTVLQHSISISGDISSTGDIIIEGAVTSNKIDIGIENTLFIGLNAIVRAKTIVAGTIIVTGDLQATSIYAEKIVTIAATGVVIGDIDTALIEIAPKGYFKGVLTLRKISA